MCSEITVYGLSLQLNWDAAVKLATGSALSLQLQHSSLPHMSLTSVSTFHRKTSLKFCKFWKLHKKINRAKKSSLPLWNAWCRRVACSGSVIQRNSHLHAADLLCELKCRTLITHSLEKPWQRTASKDRKELLSERPAQAHPPSKKLSVCLTSCSFRYGTCEDVRGRGAPHGVALFLQAHLPANPAVLDPILMRRVSFRFDYIQPMVSCYSNARQLLWNLRNLCLWWLFVAIFRLWRQEQRHAHHAQQDPTVLPEVCHVLVMGIGHDLKAMYILFCRDLARTLFLLTQVLLSCNI